MADYVPTIEEFKRLAQEGYNLIPVYREVVADMETPVSAYLKITGGGESVSFLLESVEGGRADGALQASWARSPTGCCGRARANRTAPATRSLR